MTDFQSKTYQSILAAMLSQISNAYDKRDTAPIPTALSPAAYALEGFYLTLDQVQQQAFIQTASGQSLDYLGAIAGLTRYPASAAVVLGAFNIAVPMGSRYSSVDGENSINYRVTAGTDTALQYQLTAETPGSVDSSYTGVILPINPVPGLTSAKITAILIPGSDTETDEAFRARILAALNDQPFAGNIAAYQSDILAMDGVGAVQVYPTWDGGGTVKCSILGADFLPATDTLVQMVQEAIDPPEQGLGLGLAPIGARVTIASPEAVTVAVEADLTLAAGYTVGQVQGPVEAALESYLLSVRQSWSQNVGNGSAAYAADVYVSRVLAAILTVPGVVNVADVKLGGSSADLSLTETGQTQQVPVLGTVTLNG